MRLKNIIQFVSKSMIGVTLGITLLLFICPMGITGNALMSPAGISAACHNGALTNGPAHSITTLKGCLNFHLAAVNQFTQSLFTLENNLFAGLLLFLVVVYHRFFSMAGVAAMRGFVRFKHRFRLYVQLIQVLCRKKLMAWLSFLEHSQDASLLA